MSEPVPDPNLAEPDVNASQLDWDRHFMARALDLAAEAESAGEVPIGAVLVKNNQIIGEGFNQTIHHHDASAHAEIIALRQAGQNLRNYRLPNTTLYVTLEPCPMCVGAIIHARVERLVYAATDPKTGAVEGAMDLLNHPCHNHDVITQSGVLADEAALLLRNFFKRRREEIKQARQGAAHGR